MQKIDVKVRKLDHFQGELPVYEISAASGFDLRAQLGTDQSLMLRPGERILVPTGLSLEIPPGYEIQIRPRSGWAAKKGVTVVNSPGTIDADYRGEVKIALIHLGQEELEIKDQDRVAQAVLCPVFQAVLNEATELSTTIRGAGGFGSTGFHKEKMATVEKVDQKI